MAKLNVTDFDSMPLTLLTHPTIRALCEMMDPPRIRENDYRTLSNHLNLSFDEQRRLQQQMERSNYKSMTLLLLRRWVSQEDITVQTLFGLLEEIDRPDVLREIQPLAEADLAKAKKDCENGLLRVDEGDAEHWDGILTPTVDDTLFSSDLFSPGKTFDAFISYNPKSQRDRDEMEALKRDLCSVSVGNRYLNIVVGADELISGTSLSTSLVRAIRYRCQRVIVLISRSFIKCEECVFQMQIAKGLDLASRYRKVIPVLIERGVELPDDIFNLCAVDLTNPERRSSEIRRLAASLVA